VRNCTVGNYDHVLRPRVARLALGSSSRKKPFLIEVTRGKIWTWPPLQWKCLYFWQAIRHQCYRWCFRSTSTHTGFWSYDPLLQNHGRLRSGPKAVCLDIPKREYIDVLAGPIPSGVQARPKTEYYQCYRARPKSECISTSPDPKPHIICATRPNPNPNIIRATSQTRTRILFVLPGHRAREDL
jgi:hypothetical protein